MGPMPPQGQPPQGPPQGGPPPGPPGAPPGPQGPQQGPPPAAKFAEMAKVGLMGLANAASQTPGFPPKAAQMIHKLLVDYHGFLAMVEGGGAQGGAKPVPQPMPANASQGSAPLPQG